MLDSYYYVITLSYEIPYNILDSQDENVIKAREILYQNLKDSLPEDYERFSLKLTLYQVKDTYNFLVTFNAFFKTSGNLPMENYVDARDVKENIKEELEEFFNSVDCEYKQINIKTLV